MCLVGSTLMDYTALRLKTVRVGRDWRQAATTRKGQAPGQESTSTTQAIHCLVVRTELDFSAMAVLSSVALGGSDHWADTCAECVVMGKGGGTDLNDCEFAPDFRIGRCYSMALGCHKAAQVSRLLSLSIRPGVPSPFVSRLTTVHFVLIPECKVGRTGHDGR